MRGVADVVSKSAPFSNDSPRLGGFGAVLRPKLVVAPIPPAGSGVAGAYVAAFHHYLQTELGASLPRPYQVMSGDAGSEWKRPEDLDSAFSGYLDVAPAIARGMMDNPGLRLFVGNGYYDIATTFYAAENNLARSTVPMDRVTLRNYEAGHMMYAHHPSFAALAQDLIDFVVAGSRN